MEENNKPLEENTSASESQIKTHWSFLDWFKRTKENLKELFDLHLDTDKAGTIGNIRKSIEFKGGNLWGLVFAAFIASIGLNVNSGAVVIGAMLISPLMGPIVGIGYAVATTDFETLKYAFRNLAIFIIGSIFASVLYFSISPIKTLTEQLEARTYPTFYDVLIAICGGAIGIVASSRTDRGNAIPGVAIATALMPPLCTVGYGIATGQWAYAGGAFYLFFINSVFIAGTALVVVRALDFPKIDYLNPEKERQYKLIIMVIVVGTIIPSLWTAYNVVQQEIFNSKASVFMERVNDYTEMDEHKITIVEKEINYRLDTPTITLHTVEKIMERDKEHIRKEFANLGLSKAKLEFDEGNLNVEGLLARVGVLQKDIDNMGRKQYEMETHLQENDIKSKEEEIRQLKEELAKYQSDFKHAGKPVGDIALEFSALFPEAEEISYNDLIKMNTKTQKLDTLPTVLVRWKGRGMSNTQKERMSNFFQTRMKLDTVSLIVY